MPNPLLNYDVTYFCSHNFIDVEPYQDPCGEFEDDYNNCGQCIFCTKQDYTLVARNERWKEFI